jgi:phosphoadenosine phosphosulfate reductase
MAGVKCQFSHNHTSVDYPETVRFVRSEKERMEALGYTFLIQKRRNSDGKQITMWNLIEKKGLPTRIRRWCCQELKEYGGQGQYIITGVRWAESARRKKRGVHEEFTKKAYQIIFNNDNDMRRRLAETCLRKNMFILNPIIDWSDRDVWEFLNERGVPVNPLYEAGHKRVGCIGCPMSSTARQELNARPKYKEAYIRAIAKYLVLHKEKHGEPKLPFLKSPQAFYDWWVNRSPRSGIGQEMDFPELTEEQK